MRKLLYVIVAHSNDCSGTANEFNCSYGQVYSWVNKYIKKGIDGLQDGRGHNKPVDDMNELERLRAENRLLKAEQKRQQMEIDLLKNSKKSRGGDTGQNKTSSFIILQ